MKTRRHYILGALFLLVAVCLPLTPVRAGSGATAEYSHRLIVEFDQAPLAAAASFRTASRTASGRLLTSTPLAQDYIAGIKRQQARVLERIGHELPGAGVSKRLNRHGAPLNNEYQIVLNAVVIDPGTVNIDDAIRTIRNIPGVKRVHRDRRYEPNLYASRPQTGAFTIWSNTVIGTMTNAGHGIKCASVDGGLYDGCPMFSGTGFDYPTNYPANGYGQTENNNGKIIVSRAYFRPWDPPIPGSTNAWPGPADLSHGVHTAGIMCGNPVTATYI
ncbi:MAG: hypothetical protein EOM20_21640, partial [Spartobacteria bacterium]|nr:hypothetical protein [Spartobacteria bacterium]